MMQTTNKIVSIICLITFLVGGCSKNTSEDSNQAESTTKVTVYIAKEMEFTPSLNYTGSAKAYKEANLGASIPGRVEKIHFKKGSFVPKGEVIAEMSDEMLIQAQIELEAIRKDYERLSRLKEKESISIMDYDHIKAKFDASQTKVDMLKRNTSITAPFSGTLTDIAVEEGENYTFIPSVSSDLKMLSGIATIRHLNPLKVEIEVNEKEIASINRGQEAQIEFDAYPEESFKGKVNYISPVLSSASRTATVELSIPNQNMKLKPGMFCRVSISMTPTSGVFVPMNAVYRQQGTGQEYLFIVDEDNTVTRRRVTRSESINDLVRIPQISAGETVVVDGKNKLNEGSTVEIVK